MCGEPTNLQHASKTISDPNNLELLNDITVTYRCNNGRTFDNYQKVKTISCVLNEPTDVVGTYQSIGDACDSKEI